MGVRENLTRSLNHKFRVSHLVLKIIIRLTREKIEDLRHKEFHTKDLSDSLSSPREQCLNQTETGSGYSLRQPPQTLQLELK